MVFGYGTGPMYKSGKELNHFAFYEKYGVVHIHSWFLFIICLIIGHKFKQDPDICVRCGVFKG